MQAVSSGPPQRRTERPKTARKRCFPVLVGILGAVTMYHTLSSPTSSRRSSIQEQVQVKPFDDASPRSVTHLPREPRKIFIDLGANCGNSYWYMKRHLSRGSESTLEGPGWETYLWECNPTLIDWYLNDLVAQEANVTLMPYAASTRNEELEFFLTKGQEDVTSKDQLPNGACDPKSPYNPGGASTVYGTAKRAGRRLVVSALDFLAWHRALVLQPKDVVHIKIDIEGAEVGLLNAFLADETNQMCHWVRFWNEYHKNIFPPDSADYKEHAAFEASFPHRYEQKCGRPIFPVQWS